MMTDTPQKRTSPPVAGLDFLRVFLPYELRLAQRQAMVSSSQSPDGAPSSCLGLYLVRQIVNAHRGTVEIAETGPDGTTFRVSLPDAEPVEEGV